MTAKIRWSVNGGQSQIETRECGHLPIMVKVSREIFELERSIG